MASHDTNLQRAFERMEQAGLRLNKEKCVFRQSELRLLGNIVDAQGVRADPEKVRAINDLQEPTNMHKLKRVLGMINYMGKYILELSTVGGPLYDLLKGQSAWVWDQPQQQALRKLKQELASSPVLAHYDTGRETAVSADASSYGIGGVLLQLYGSGWKLVAYCSGRLTEN